MILAMTHFERLFSCIQMNKSLATSVKGSPYYMAPEVSGI